MIIIEYGNSMSKIRGTLMPSVIEELSYELSYEVPNMEKTDAYLYTDWDGRKRLFYKGNYTFPSGLLYIVEDVLERNYVEYTIIGREFPDIIGDIDIESTKLRDYQLNAVIKAVEAGRGLIHIATAGGKSYVALGIIKLVGRKSLIVVHRKELADQFMNHCDTFGFKSARLQGIKSMRFYNSKDWEAADVYIAMFQTLHSSRIKEPTIFYNLVKNIEVFICDEVHRTGSNTYYKTMMEFDDTPYRFGMSATVEGRSDGADMLLRAVTGDVVVRETEESLMDGGWIATPDIYMIYTNAEHDSMYEWDSVYREGIVNNVERNENIVNATIKLVKSGKMVLVLCNYIAHGMTLLEQINAAMPSNLPQVAFIHGSTPKSIREGELNRFRKADTLCLIMSSVGREGVDIPACDAVVVAEGMKSRILASQRAGRALRSNSSGKAIIVDFIDKDDGMLLKHSRVRARVYKDRGFKVIPVGADEFLRMDFT